MAKRRIYKPDRAPARTKGVLKVGDCSPVSLPDASPGEIAKAIFALCKEAGVKIGRVEGYEPLKDEYYVIGKSRITGKAQTITVKGFEVGAVIQMFRNALLYGVQPNYI